MHSSMFMLFLLRPPTKPCYYNVRMHALLSSRGTKFPIYQGVHLLYISKIANPLNKDFFSILFWKLKKHFFGVLEPKYLSDLNFFSTKKPAPKKQDMFRPLSTKRSYSKSFSTLMMLNLCCKIRPCYVHNLNIDG